jgi:hypothetical protein
MSIGRNDPCPCGSGKTFKRCHGASVATAANPNVARANEFKALDMDLASRLLRFAKSYFGARWLENELSYFAGSPEGKVPEHELALAIPWALYSHRDIDGRTLADTWARERGTWVTDRERNLLDAYASTWLSLWEVKSVERGVGTALVDLLTREERFAYDASSSGMLHVHDVMLCMIVDCDGVSFFGGAHPKPLPPRYADSALRAARKICGVQTRAVAPDILRRGETQLNIIDAWKETIDSMLGPSPPTLTNTDGDLFTLTTDDFAITAPRETIIDRLASIEGASEPETKDGNTVFVFTKPGNPMNAGRESTIVARAVVGRDHLRVETNSLRRADTLRATLEASLGGMIRYRLRRESNTDDMMKHAAARSPTTHAAPRTPHPPEISAALREFREKHMRGWIDESIPVLDGLTPREAARLPRKRPALELLLKDIESSESRLPPDEQIDLSWIRPALGLERH